MLWEMRGKGSKGRGGAGFWGAKEHEEAGGTGRGDEGTRKKGRREWSKPNET